MYYANGCGINILIMYVFSSVQRIVCGRSSSAGVRNSCCSTINSTYLEADSAAQVTRHSPHFQIHHLIRPFTQIRTTLDQGTEAIQPDQVVDRRICWIPTEVWRTGQFRSIYASRFIWQQVFSFPFVIYFCYKCCSLTEVHKITNSAVL